MASKILLPRVQFRAKVLFVHYVDGFANTVKVRQLTELYPEDMQHFEGYEIDIRISQETADRLSAFEVGEVYTFVVDLWARSVYKSGDINYYLASAFKG